MVARQTDNTAPGDLIPDEDGQRRALPALAVPSAAWAADVAERSGDSWPRHVARARKRRHRRAAKRGQHVTRPTRDSRPTYDKATGTLRYPKHVHRFEPYAFEVRRDERAANAADGDQSAGVDGHR